LLSLESCEDRLRGLREQENHLEVEHIAARAALKSAAHKGALDIEPALAMPIGRALELRGELEERLCRADEIHTTPGVGSSRQADRLRTGCAALEAWLDGSRPRKPAPVVRAAKIMLLIVTILTVWAAIAIHPAFLLILAVVIGPVSFAMGRGQDAQWHRVAARRRFATSGLADFDDWTEDGVRAHLAELESMLEAAALERARDNSDAPESEPIDTETLSRQIADNNRQLASALARAELSIEDTKGDSGNWLRSLARAQHAHESLDRVKSERERLRAEAVELREQLQSYLQSQGVKPTELGDTAAAISLRLEDLAKSS